MKKNNATSDVRERIVSTASRLFYQQGYNATGINQVIAEADVAKASLYQHFPSKEDLLHEYLLRAGQEWIGPLLQKAKEAATLQEKILLPFDLFAEFTKCMDYRGCNFQNIISEIPAGNVRITDLVRQQKLATRNYFQAQLSALGKPELADEIYIIFEGACIVSQLYGHDWALGTARNLVQRMI
jgi:AcrR family transcriptional regulator